MSGPRWKHETPANTERAQVEALRAIAEELETHNTLLAKLLTAWDVPDEPPRDGRYLRRESDRNTPVRAERSNADKPDLPDPDVDVEDWPMNKVGFVRRIRGE